MLEEQEIRERAEYCYLVFMQLSCLRDNMHATPERYLDYLKGSTLRLAEDDFIRSLVEEELRMGSHDGGLGYLITLFEGFAHAYSEVIQIPLEEIRNGLPLGLRDKLASEMDRKLRKIRKKARS
ncbi:MAG: hypothetical protein PHU03_01755 [Syntrophales bacterium]|nr:hypothetical protein [Syntrophales bacterium]